MKNFWYNNWWFFLYIISILFWFENSSRSYTTIKKQLNNEINHLYNNKKMYLALNQTLRSNVFSQKDSNFVQLVLMEFLGLTPAKSKKIFFNPTTTELR